MSSEVPAAETTDTPAVEQATAAEQPVLHPPAPSSGCSDGEATAPPSAPEAVVAGSDDSAGTRTPGVPHAKTRAAGERSPPPGGASTGTPVLEFVPTPPPGSPVPHGAPLTPAPPPMPTPMPPPVPSVPTGSCGTGAAGSYATGGGSHGGSGQDLAVLGGEIPAPALSDSDLSHSTDVDPVTHRADDPGSPPD